MTASDPIMLLLGKMDGVKPAGLDKWMARCPNHDDAHASLSVARGEDGRVLLFCHSCGKEATPAIVAKIGLTMRDLSPTNGDGQDRPAGPTRESASKPAKTYSTADEAIAAAARQTSGTLAHRADYTPDFIVARLQLPATDPETGKPEKTCRPVSRNRNGWAIKDPPGLLPLYGLDKLPPTGPVCIVEGEPKVDALRLIGLPAVTSAHGAKAADRSDWAPLAGREVWLFPDNDPAGRDYAAAVTAILTALGCTVRIVNLPGLPVAGDVVDWLDPDGPMGSKDADQCRSAILSLANAAPIWASPAMQSEASQEKDDTPADNWPEPQPLPAGLPDVLAFDFGLLPTALCPWIKDIAERMQCPPDYCASTAMILAGSLIGRKITIRPKRHDDWTVVPNLYGVNIGRPSLMKSPAMKEVVKPAVRLEIDAKKKYDEELATFEAAELVADAKTKVGKENIRQAVREGGDPQAIAAAMSKEHPIKPVRRRYHVNNSTVEKLGVILAENPNGVLIFQDELVNLLRTMDREGHEGDRAFYLTAWNGDSRYTYDRIGRGTTDIEAAIVSIVGAATPDAMGSYLFEAVCGGGGDDGLMQRMQMTVWPDPPGTWCNVDRYPDLAAKNTAYAALEQLDDLAAEKVGGELDRFDASALPFLRFDDVGQALFDAWRDDLERRLRSGQDHPAVESHLAKFRSLIPSLALILHLLDGGNGPVGAVAVEKAIRWGRYLESHARRLYAGVTEAPAVAARLLARRIQTGDVKDDFASRDVYRHGWTGLGKDRTEAALDVLVSLHWLEEHVEPTPGRSRTRYWINPKIAVSPKNEPTKPTEAPSGSSVSAPAEDKSDSATW